MYGNPYQLFKKKNQPNEQKPQEERVSTVKGSPPAAYGARTRKDEKTPWATGKSLVNNVPLQLCISFL